jgi:hypothetical protein
MTCDVCTLIIGYLSQRKPHSVLVFGDAASQCLEDYAVLQPACQQLVIGSPDDFPNAKFDAAVVLGCIEYLHKPAAHQLIARLRDTVAVDLLVGVPLWHDEARYISHWQDSDFLALGMQIHAHLQTSAGMLGFYHFAIYDYKPVPDWLNAQYWAHPERWEP